MEERQFELICLLACSPPPMASVTASTVINWSSRSRSQSPASGADVTTTTAGARAAARAAADVQQSHRQQQQQQQQQEEPTISGLLVFLRFLLQKNRGALRDIPPPGLSDATVLMSAFFALLRLLQPALKAAGQGQGPLAAFPAAQILASSSPPAEAEVVHELPR